MDCRQFITKLKQTNICSGILSDSLDKLQLRNQVLTGLKSQTRLNKVFGMVRTVNIETKSGVDENIHMGLSFLEKLSEDDVLVVKGSQKFAYFGELMSRLSIRQKLNGVVINGLTRDTCYTHTNIGLPIFCSGYSPVDIKGRGFVKTVDTTIQLSSIIVKSGDIVFGDGDGIVFIPNNTNLLLNLYDLVTQSLEEEESIKEKIEYGICIEQLLQHHKEF